MSSSFPTPGAPFWRDGGTKTAQYTALNPRQKIPLLQDGSITLGESAAIIAYLARTYSTGERRLLPAAREDEAKWFEWCFFISRSSNSSSLYVMRRHGTNRGLAHIYGSAPEVVQQAAEYFRHQLTYVDCALRDGRCYLMGDQFTTADILLTSCLVWAVSYGVAVCESVPGYLERTTGRPAYEAAGVANTAPGQ